MEKEVCDFFDTKICIKTDQVNRDKMHFDEPTISNYS